MTSTVPRPPTERPDVLAGRTLRMMREPHRVGLRELAAKAGISAGYLSRIETGRRRASGDVMQRICDTIARLPA